MSKSVLLQSSIAKKYWMALTGLFLCLFLVGHLLGNLQLLLPVSEASDSFNLYAKFMTTNPVVKILSYITYFSILFHIVDGILITIQNKKARPVSYAFNKPSANSSWTSRNMGVLGTVLLFFLIVHMRSFWYEMHFGEMPTTLIDGQEFKDLYLITTQAFEQLWYVIFYVVCMVAVAFHLSHGFSSAFQTLGANHPKYNQLVKKIGFAFGIIIPAAFAIIPLAIYFR
ncbi:MAG: succinate dehydrogenase cytochrome b subunit [Bacteroidota bacterium]|nr:succinate dehydrogenase cytochrome b subunit [Bacteroidota bacterium]